MPDDPVFQDVTPVVPVLDLAAAGVEGRLGEVQETEYGMREFGFVDPDGTLHRVGSRQR